MSDNPISPTLDLPVAVMPGVIADRRDLALAAFERTPMPMVVTDARQRDQPIVMANQAFLDLCGFSADEVIGRNCRFMQGPGTDAAVIRRIGEAVAAEEALTVELLNYRRDGSSFWNSLQLSPIYDDERRLLYYFASQKDVSREHQLRVAEADEHRLLREVDHRARNALALVQGIVRLTRAPTAETYSRSVQRRVDALAQAHSILAETRWCDVPLSRLVQSALAPFGSTRTSFEGLDVMIGAGQVQPLVLLFHELVANAAEHGSLSAPGGTIGASWHEDGGRVVITLTETGGPPPSEKRVPGFGLTMVEAFIRRQLRGDVAFDWRPEGLETVLTVPVERGEADDKADNADPAGRAAVH